VRWLTFRARQREWLRKQKHPGIVFVATITGERHAALKVGPEVWSLAESWLQHDWCERTAAAVAVAVGLAPADVEAALGYWADNEDEINELVARHRVSQDEALAAWERR